MLESKLLAVGLKHLSLGSLTTSNLGIQIIGSWAKYLSLGIVTTNNFGIQAIGRCALVSGRKIPENEQFWNLVYWQLS